MKKIFSLFTAAVIISVFCMGTLPNNRQLTINTITRQCGDYVDFLNIYINGKLPATKDDLNSYSLLNHNHDSLYAALTHSHAMSQITGLLQAFMLYAPADHNHDSAYAPINHNHDSLYAALMHSHAMSQITGLLDALASYADASNITSGTLDGDRLPAMSATKPGAVPATGTPSGKFLKDDGTFAAPPGASGGEANTASNIGSEGVGVFASKSGVDLRFKKLKEGTGITITNGSEEITISGGMPTASASQLGAIKIGSGLSIDEFGVVTTTGGGSELTVQTLGTSGTQTINRSTSDKWSVTPSASMVTLATSNFSDLQKATLKIIDGAARIYWPSDWQWDVPRVLDVTTTWDDYNYTWVTNTTKESTPPVLQITGYNLFELTGVNYNSSTKIFVKHIGFFFDEERVPASLILHMNGADDGETFTDSGANNVTVTRNGNVVTKTGVKQLGTASGYFNGNFLSMPSAACFNPANQNFTIETWIYPVNTERAAICAMENDSNFAIGFSYNGDSKISVWTQSSWSGSNCNTALSLNTWHHIAVTKSGTTWKVYVDGTLDGTFTLAGSFTDMTSQNFNVGRWGGDAGDVSRWDGYMDEFIITMGAVRYKSNFTPPTTER